MNFSRATGLLILLASLSYASTALPAELPSTLKLVTHNAVAIKAEAGDIWPHILDPNHWKAGAELLPVEGKDHLFKAVMPDYPETVAYFVENVELEVEHRRTIRLVQADGSLLGYASWELTPLDEGVMVEYHVYSEMPAPPQFSPEELKEVQTAYTHENASRFQSELETLKKLVEEEDISD